MSYGILDISSQNCQLVVFLVVVSIRRTRELSAIGPFQTTATPQNIALPGDYYVLLYYRIVVN